MLASMIRAVRSVWRRRREEAQSLRGRILEALSPQAPLSVTVEELEGKKLIVIDVPQGLEKPYVCNGKIMVKRGGTVVTAVASDVSTLIGQRAQTEGRWERMSALGVEENDLDGDLIRKVATTIKERRGYAVDPAKKPTKILERLGLVHSGQFSNAALVLFGKNPVEWYPQTRVRAARFQSDDPTAFIDNRVFEGSLFSLIEAIASFVQAHTPVVSSLAPDELQRRDRLAYPLPAVREAIVNALVHRDYSAFDGGMSVALYDGRIEFWNSGSLPEDMTVEDLRKSHPSRPMNPDIAQVCFLYGLMEALGYRNAKDHPRLPRGWTSRTRMACGRKRGDANPACLRQGDDTTGDQFSEPSVVVRRQATRPGEKVKLPDYLKLVFSKVKARQARIDLTHLTEAGFLQRVGAGPATTYVRTNKQVTELPSE